MKSPCRICHSQEETRDDPLVAPCHCDGSLRFVHNSCQQAWLRARRGPRNYKCELCRASLTCRLTLTTRLEVACDATASAVVWIVQVASAWRIAHVVFRLLAASWRQAGSTHASGPAPALLRNAVRLLPPASAPSSGSESSFMHGTAWHTVAALSAVLFSHSALAIFRRPLALLGEDQLSRFCMVKIGCCVLVLLHDVLWTLPTAQRPAPSRACQMVTTTLLMDTVLAAFFRIPQPERGTRSIMPRVALAACRLTGDFLPFAAVFFLWSASIIMILTASLIPCMALLFHEAIRDLRRRRGRHGTVQMLVLILRTAVRVFALSVLSTGPACRASAWCEQGVTALWLTVEGSVLWDILFRRRGLCCAYKVSSQVLWTLAVAGHILLATLTTTPCSPATRGSSSLRGSHRSSATSLFHSWPSLFETGPPDIHTSEFNPVAGSTGQEVALLLCIAAYVAIHAPVFAAWASKGRQMTLHAFACIEPDRVVFYDCKHRLD